MQQEPKQTATASCPRCGGPVHTLRRFTRWGRTVLVLLCRDCKYAEYRAGSSQAML